MDRDYWRATQRRPPLCTRDAQRGLLRSFGSPRRSPDGAAGCLGPHWASSRRSSRSCAVARPMPPTRILCSAIPRRETRSTAPSSRGGSKKAIGRAHVREITFHELRHTFGTRVAAAGVPLRTIQHWTGPRGRQDDPGLCPLPAL
ncbi:MAG: tyrosine-type recombinase/integrase [Solirubrobacteraceae bacterium]